MRKPKCDNCKGEGVINGRYFISVCRVCFEYPTEEVKLLIARLIKSGQLADHQESGKKKRGMK